MPKVHFRKTDHCHHCHQFLDSRSETEYTMKK
jgi:hypothetical protein